MITSEESRRGGRLTSAVPMSAMPFLGTSKEKEKSSRAFREEPSPSFRPGFRPSFRPSFRPRSDLAKIGRGLSIKEDVIVHDRSRNV
eukprot:CAMPEP_0182504448 /NCGR_PEP_ID=MMETSP1321-20130603/17232_1 /TAXON_ID=91990 /ORGANISM="Bolidomonas sp., Strain RCC1657" /LENGTH=86 /DNA_ID=CAMNT_0024709809 /DNA_START=262 /DNA_END=519 /DNA_ORIENTATION=-